MRLLLDTHAFLWFLAGTEALPLAARAAISNEENAIFLSVASAWEIAIKYRLGRLPIATAIVGDFEGALQSQGFSALPITLCHAERAGALPLLHNDPFDRMLIAQALLENLVLVSNEKPFDAYGITRLW